MARLTSELRAELKKPLGPLVSERLSNLLADVTNHPPPLSNAPDTLSSTKSRPLVVTVGDIITYTSIREGMLPDVCILDAHSWRKRVSNEIFNVNMHPLFMQVDVVNPPASLTRELVLAIKEALVRAAGEKPNIQIKTRIFIKGEEDLAVLPVVALAPEGTVVLYGQPDEGYVYLNVNALMKKNIREVLSSMEVLTPEEDAWRIMYGD